MSWYTVQSAALHVEDALTQEGNILRDNVDCLFLE